MPNTSNLFSMSVPWCCCVVSICSFRVTSEFHRGVDMSNRLFSNVVKLPSVCHSVMSLSSLWIQLTIVCTLCSDLVFQTNVAEHPILCCSTRLRKKRVVHIDPSWSCAETRDVEASHESCMVATLRHNLDRSMSFACVPG
jgi:hypothetical protein